MALIRREVTNGAVAYFDVTVLHQDARVTKPESPVPEDRSEHGNQFVCYETRDGNACWASLTTVHRDERLNIRPDWVTNGYGPLAEGGVYMSDGRTTYRGPIEAFVEAATGERIFRAGRPRVTAEGIAAIRAEVNERGGQRL